MFLLKVYGLPLWPRNSFCINQGYVRVLKFMPPIFIQLRAHLACNVRWKRLFVHSPSEIQNWGPLFGWAQCFSEWILGVRSKDAVLWLLGIGPVPTSGVWIGSLLEPPGLAGVEGWLLKKTRERLPLAGRQRGTHILQQLLGDRSEPTSACFQTDILYSVHGV